mgnify:CR=1 FL=1
MIVTCPSCDTKYEVLRDILIPNGRRLRCVRCKHTWTERPPSVNEALDDEDDDEIEVPSLDEINQSSGALKSKSDETSEDDFDDEEDDDEDDEDEDDEDEEEDEAPKKKKRKKGLFGKILKSLLLIIFILIILIAILLNRGRILEFWPPSKAIFELSPIEKLYKSPLFKKLYDLPYVDVGNINSISSGGLYISPPIPNEQIIDSVSNLIIKGVVENQSSIRLQVPATMQAVILDNSQKEIIVSEFPAPVDNLLGGSKFDYEHVLQEVPEEISNIIIRFKIKDSNELSKDVSTSRDDMQKDVPKSSSSSGRTVNKEKAAKLKKVFE